MIFRLDAMFPDEFAELMGILESLRFQQDASNSGGDIIHRLYVPEAFVHAFESQSVRHVQKSSLDRARVRARRSKLKGPKAFTDPVIVAPDRALVKI